MLQNLDFDFSLFEDVPSPKSHNTVCRLTLAAEDRLSQNEAFHRALQGTTAFRLQVSSDGRFLRLDPNGPCNLTFTNAGVRTHHPFGDLLRQKGLEPPLSYLMCWREDLDCWVGQYDGLTAPTPVPRPRDRKRQKPELRHEAPSMPFLPGASLGRQCHWPALYPTWRERPGRGLPFDGMDRVSRRLSEFSPHLISCFLALCLWTNQRSSRCGKKDPPGSRV